MNKTYTILDTIGNTPLVELTHITKGLKARVFAKLEGCNPGGSIKDRTAYYMIRKAEESGELKPGKIIVEPTVGQHGNRFGDDWCGKRI